MVETGQEVKKGDTLLIMEAMKMESPVSSSFNGKIGSIAVSLNWRSAFGVNYN